jgi:hypothetical protein
MGAAIEVNGKNMIQHFEHILLTLKNEKHA